MSVRFAGWPVSRFFPGGVFQYLEAPLHQSSQAILVQRFASLDLFLPAKQRAAHAAGEMRAMRIGGDALQPRQEGGEQDEFGGCHGQLQREGSPVFNGKKSFKHKVHEGNEGKYREIKALFPFVYSLAPPATSSRHLRLAQAQVCPSGGQVLCSLCLGSFSPNTGEPTKEGAPGENRTLNLLIRSQALYPLSYGGTHGIIPIRRASRNR